MTTWCIGIAAYIVMCVIHKFLTPPDDCKCRKAKSSGRAVSAPPVPTGAGLGYLREDQLDRLAQGAGFEDFASMPESMKAGIHMRDGMLMVGEPANVRTHGR